MERGDKMKYRISKDIRKWNKLVRIRKKKRADSEWWEYGTYSWYEGQWTIYWKKYGKLPAHGKKWRRLDIRVEKSMLQNWIDSHHNDSLRFKGFKYLLRLGVIYKVKR